MSEIPERSESHIRTERCNSPCRKFFMYSIGCKAIGTGIPGTTIRNNVNPDEVVAQWACITAVKSYEPVNTSFANVSVSLYTRLLLQY